MSLKLLIIGAMLAIVAGKDLGASNSLMCYECNSIDDPRCADFDNKENIQKFQPVNCSAQLTTLKRTEWGTDYKTTNICRKTHQMVQGNLRVSRGCGFIAAESYDDKKCMRRTGTKDITIFYCSCSDSLCNASNQLLNHQQVVYAVLIASVLSFLMQRFYF